MLCIFDFKDCSINSECVCVFGDCDVCGCWHKQVMAGLWRSKGNFQEWLLSFHHGILGLNSGHYACRVDTFTH